MDRRELQPTDLPFPGDGRFRRTPTACGGQSIFRSEVWRDSCLNAWKGLAIAHEFRSNLAQATDSIGVTQSQPEVIALLGRRTQWRHGLLPVRVLALNQSSIAALDQIWIEKNGFFGVNDGQFEVLFDALLTELLAQPDWDELWLSGMTETCADSALTLGALRGLECRVELEQPNYQVDLDAIRTRHKGRFLDSISANTRQQLRRSLRLAQSALGPVELHEATCVDEALAWFECTSPLHRSRWGAADPLFGSGFDNPAFVAFHRDLIARGFRQGAIQYLRLSCGPRPVAYLYNLISGPVTEFYLSGIDYQALTPQCRPGLLAHWYAIEHNLTRGQQVYDFLAGEARYKRSLSNRQGRTVWIIAQRPRLKLRIESMARSLKRQWFRPANQVRSDD